MGIVLDIVIVAIIALNIFICYKKGLVNLAVGLIAVVGSIILALILYKPVSNLVIEKTDIDEKIENLIIESFSAENSDGEEVRYVGVIDYIEKYAKDIANKTQNEIVYETAGTMAVKIINVVAILGIFIIARALLLLLTFISDMITSLPIIKQCNEVGGVIYGIIKGFLIVFALLAIAFLIIFITGNTTVSNVIDGSYITKFLYENNLILKILF